MKTVWTHVVRGYARWEHYLTTMEGAEEVIASSGISFHLWRLYQHFWLLVCLLFPIASLVQTPLAPARLFLALAALVFFAASYTWLMWSHPASSGARARARSPASLILFVILVALVLVLSLAYGLAFLWLFIGVSAIAGVLLPVRSALVAVTVLLFLPLIISVGTAGGVTRVDWLQLIPLVLLVRGLGLDMIGLARLSSALRELHAAREERARLAVMEERLRLARDLHDLLGHTLSMIALKSELAGRLVEQEPARAVQEIRDVERVARQALREVREAVAGYRQPALSSELEGAQHLLEAAGIEYQFEQTAGDLPPSIDAVLAWTVREGVTNVIRHSRARWCHIRITRENGTVRAEEINDGDIRGLAESTQARTGSGLAGLTERVKANGGRIEGLPLRPTEPEASHDSGVVGRNKEGLPLRLTEKEGFRLLVELPIQRSGEAAREELL
jgi:two-component system, NarL family, sensor histidine kinase DesK